MSLGNVRAKFKTQRIERSLQSVVTGKDERGTKVWGMAEVHTTVLTPVSSGSTENEMFYASTPSGEIKLTSIHPGLFELGKDYYVDFTPAD